MANKEQEFNNEVAVRVESLSKTFKIPHERHTTLKSAAINLFSNKGYEVFNALQDINFEVKKGEFFGIIGRNGSGKSTLLKILAGIYVPDKGKGIVTINGKLSPFLELGVGFNPELTARENVFLGGAILGLSRKEVAEKFDKIVGFAELEEFIDMKFKNFSSGMQVRLAFALAINAHAEILLMDEVLAVGDTNFQNKCLNEFKRYKKQGKTVILVSHDIQTIEEYCDRALLLNKGKMVSIGPTKHVSLEYQQINMKAENEKLKQNQSSREREDGVYGNKKADIYQLKIFDEKGNETQTLESGKEFTLKLRTKFKEDLKDVSFNVTFRDEAGNNKLVLHSLYSNKPAILKKVRRGDDAEVVFKGEMLLAQGTYSLYVDACSDVRYPKYKILFAKEKYTEITVFSNEMISGPINFKHKTEININK